MNLIHSKGSSMYFIRMDKYICNQHKRKNSLETSTLAWTFKYFVLYFWIFFGSSCEEFQQSWGWILILLIDLDLPSSTMPTYYSWKTYYYYYYFISDFNFIRSDGLFMLFHKMKFPHKSKAIKPQKPQTQSITLFQPKLNHCF